MPGTFVHFAFRRAVIFAAAVTCCAFNCVASASPWSRDNNELLVISQVQYFEADLGPVNTIDGIVDSKFERLESNLYLEFGLTEKITIGAKALYGSSWLTRGTRTETASGFSEVEIFAQRELFRSSTHVGSVKIAGTLPSRFSSGARPGLQSEGFDTAFSALYGRDLHIRKTKIFAAIEAGYKKRFSDAADQIQLQGTVGIEPTDSFLILIESFSLLSVQNEKPQGPDYDIWKVQPSIVWKANKTFRIQVGITEEIASRNLPRGRTFFIGLWSDF